MYCEQCGEILNDDAKFCKNCGKKASADEKNDEIQESEYEGLETENLKNQEETEIKEIKEVEDEMEDGELENEDGELKIEAAETDGLPNEETETILEKSGILQKLFSKNLPLDKNKKLIAIISIAVILLAGSFYYIFDTQKKIDRMMDEINSTETRFDEYIISGNEKEYEEILVEISEIEGVKDFDEVKELFLKINTFEATLLDSNQKTMNQLKEATNKKDIQRAYEDELQKIEEYKKAVDSLLQQKKFVSAEKIFEEWNSLLDQINIVHDNYQISVNQMDFSDFPRIKMYLNIEDLYSGEVPGNLDPRFFCISEKNAKNPEYIKQNVIKATQLDQLESLNINMVADISGSMEGYPLESAQSIMSSFLDYVQFGIGDKVELTAFADGVYTCDTFTDDVESLKSEIFNLCTGDMTALYDALFAAVNTTAVQDGAKCVIAFTDGCDNFSNSTPDDVIAISQRYNIPIFIVGVGDFLDTTELTRIAESTNGRYQNVSDLSEMADLYASIYKQQKQMYLVEYETQYSGDMRQNRSVNIDVQTRDDGGSVEHEFTPLMLMDAEENVEYEDAVDNLIASYLRNYVKAINNHDYSYIQDYIVQNSGLEKQVKPYIMKDIQEKLLSFEILSKDYKGSDTCIVSLRETYEIQNHMEPLHMRVLEGKLELKKDSNGKWRLNNFADSYKLLSKLNY